MYYINRKVDEKWEVVDTEEGVSELYTSNELKEYLDQGVHINGAIKVNNEFSFTFVGDIINLTKQDMTKNKLLHGTCTGIAGFDLEFRDNDIIALPLKPSYVDYIKGRTDGSVYIIQLPEIVTELSDKFLSVVIDYNNWFFSSSASEPRFYLELPSSVTDLCCDNIGNWVNLEIIHFNGVLRKLYRRDAEFFSATSIFKFLGEGEDTLHIKEFGSKTLDLQIKSLLRLPDVEVLSSDCFVASAFRDIFEFYLGTSISYIGNFHFNVPEMYCIDTCEYVLFDSNLMELANIVYLPDNCNLSVLDLSDTSSKGCYSSYIFVLSRSEYERLSGVFADAKINERSTVGIICYENEDELKFIQRYIRLVMDEVDEYFETKLTKNSLGKVNELKLCKWSL